MREFKTWPQIYLDGEPLARVTPQYGTRLATSDATGRFLLTDIPDRYHPLLMQGHTANAPGKTYGTFEYGVRVEAKKTNVLPFTIWMPLIDTEHAIQLPGGRTQRKIVATTPKILGLEVHIPAGVTLRASNGQLLESLSLTPISLDRTPFPVEPGTLVFIAPQGHGTMVESHDGAMALAGAGVRVIFPNTANHPPGTKLSFRSYDAHGFGWYTLGQLTVSADGRQIASAPGVTLGEVGCVLTLAMYNGVVATYAYSTRDELTSITFKKGAITLGTLTYTYDAAGRRQTVGGTWARTGLPAAVASATYDDANRQLSWGGQTLIYDDNGNLTGDGVNTYTWDARDRLTGISGGATATFAYDPFGRRTRKTISGQTTDYLYDWDNPVQELSGGVVLTNLLTGLGIDEYFTRTDGTGRRSLLGDALGSILALTDDAGVVQTSYTYEPFGTTSVTGQANTNSPRAWSRPPTPTSPLVPRPSLARATPTPSSTPAARTTARGSTTTGRGTTAPSDSGSFLKIRSDSWGEIPTSTLTFSIVPLVSLTPSVSRF
jgi:YD repeat-containing protein